MLRRARELCRRLRRRREIAPPVRARHVEWSAISSLDDQRPGPTARLLDVAIGVVQRARSVDLTEVAMRARNESQRRFVLQWPGEHYRLLAALVHELQPHRVVEVGTACGLSALSLRVGMPPGGQVVTYDLRPWSSFPDTALLPADFRSGALEQRIGDLSELAFFARERATIAGAGLIFLDGPKDGKFEPWLLPRLLATAPKGALLVLDDTRCLNMLQCWRDLEAPKLDLTSFGHWTGTGLVEVG